MVITEVPPGVSLQVYPFINQVLKETPDSDAELLYISEGGANILNLYRQPVAPALLHTTGRGTLNFNYKPDTADAISRLRFVIQVSGNLMS